MKIENVFYLVFSLPELDTIQLMAEQRRTDDLQSMVAK
jgi:hypothetical protein